VKVVRESTEQLTTSQSWVNLPNASTTITVPSGQTALILARFSAESSCTNDADPDGWPCNVRILIGGVEGGPASGNDFAFDTAACCQGDVDGRESHSVDRSRLSVPAGTYTVQVQWKTTGGSLFSLDDWSLTVERAQM
jgi:hypothetical protein